jgi:heme-degrading monooxygenase HmoA
MIARMWHGYTTPENADAYEAILKPEVLPGVGRSQGYQGSYFLRRNLGTEVEFVTVMLWESFDAIRAFAGPNYEVAIVPPERRRVLKRFDEKSAHYEVVSHP